MRRWAVAVGAALAGSSAGFAPAAAQAGHVSGRITIQEKDNAPSPDLGDAVVYLVGQGVALPAARFEIAITDKTFAPHVLVVPAGSTVAFPNHDPFDHNVFSAGEGNSFDLGLYGRGEGKSFVFTAPGPVRIYCNVHPRMAAVVYVMPNRWYAQPGGDGSFSISSVPPGDYRLHVWHERAPAEVVKNLTVTAQGPGGDVLVTLDARGFKYQAHKNKYGRDYPTNAGRERY